MTKIVPPRLVFASMGKIRRCVARHKGVIVCVDSKAPSMPFAEYALNENRYRMLKMMNPEHADELMDMSQKDVEKGWKFLEGRAKALEPEK